MEFLLLALAAGIGVALMAAPLGAFVVWQRLAYFGDTLAHASLLGIALGLMLGINLQVAIIASGIVIAFILYQWQTRSLLANDTLLGIMSHSALALGLVLISVTDTGRLDLNSYLLGDILSTTYEDLLLIYGLIALVVPIIFYFWKPLLKTIISEDLAAVEGVDTKKMRLLLTVLLAVTVAIAIKIVGVLLITALLIIPAASARYFSQSPEQMVINAAIVACLSVMGGLASSFFIDTPAGPSIVVCASVFFLLAMSYYRRERQ